MKGSKRLRRGSDTGGGAHPRRSGVAAKRRALSLLFGLVLAITLALGMAGSAQAAPVQYFYVPFPEDDLLTSFQAIDNDPVNPITTYIVITAVANDTVVYYDQWENGFDVDITSSLNVYSAANLGGTQIWGDGNTANGAPPGISSDIIDAGTTIILSNDVTTTNLLAIDFDGGDKLASTKTIALTRSSWAAGSTTLLAGCVEVFDTNNWGTDYRAPVGLNLADNVDFQMFSYTALSIMAGPKQATVQIDAAGDGTFETTVTLAEGASTYVTGVYAGGHVVSDNPVQVDIFVGDIESTYESRDSALVPTSMWADSYYTPVSTPDYIDATHTDADTTAWLYNPGTSAITVTYERRNAAGNRVTSALSVPAGGVAKQVLENATNGTASCFYSSGASAGAVFYAFSTTDSNEDSAGYPRNMAWDWGFTMIPRTMLTTEALVGLGLGRDPTSPTNPDENGNPAWVTTVGNGDTAATVYVDYDADPTTGIIQDASGYWCDASYSLRELEQAKIYVREGPVVDATSSGTTGGDPGFTATQLNITHVTGTASNRLMLVSVAIANDSAQQRTVSSVTYGGVNLTAVGSVRAPTGGGGDESTTYARPRLYIYAMANPPSGSATVRVTLSGTKAFVVGVTTFSGVDVSSGLTSALGTFASASAATGTTQSIAVTTVEGQMVYDAVAAGVNARDATADPSAFTLGAGQSQLWTQFARSEDGTRDRHVRAAGSTETATGASSTTMSWTTTTSYPWAIGAVPINPAPDPTAYNDQTGILIYTLDKDVKLAVAWGQDPLTATASAPGLDVGTSVPPMPEFTAGKDGLLYDDPSTPGVIDGDHDDDGYITCGDEIVWPITVYNVSRIPVPDVNVSDVIPADTTYVPNTTYLNGATQISDSGSTAFPLDEGGYDYGNLPVGGSFVVTFRVVIDDYDDMTPGTLAIENNGVANALDRDDPVDDRVFLRGRIGDFVWYDTNMDGIQDAGELGIEGITVRLLDSAGSQLYNADSSPMVMVTDSSGFYEFTGLPPADYIVEFVAPDGSGFSPQDQGGSDVLDSDANATTGRTGLVTLVGGQRIRTVDAGIYRTSPTVVVISSFDASTVKNGVAVTWETASEANTAGFYLERLDAKTGRWARVDRVLLPALFESATGGSYTLVDRGAKAGTLLTYRVVEVEMTGPERIYGPYEVTATEALAPGEAFTAIANGEQAVRIPRRAKPQDSESPQVMAESVLLTTDGADRLRIEVTAPGLYRVDAADLVAGLGITEDQARRLVLAKGVKLTNQGRSVAYLQAADGSALFFYGQALENSIYSSGNVYWLTLGRGVTMAAAKKAATKATAETSFVEVAHAEENVFPITEQFHEPGGDFWLWDYLVAGFAPLDRKVFTVDATDVQTGIRLDVVLRGLTSTGTAGEHHSIVTLNGTTLGGTQWTGTGPYKASFAIPAGALHEGANEAAVEAVLDSGIDFSLFAVDSFDVIYKRGATAVADQLLFKAPATSLFEVSGLSSGQAWVLDLAKPLTPALVPAAGSGGDPGGAWVKFAATKGRQYLVATAAGAMRPDVVAATVGTTLRAAGRGAEYVVIAAPALAEAAARLTAYRAGQGLSVAVVTTTDIYDEFNYGSTNPYAIQKFIKYALASWAPAPRYVVLAGEGSYDYKDYAGNGDSLVPPVMVDTEFGLVPSDVKLADATGADGSPEVAIGRIPVLAAAGLDAALAEIQAYEAGGGAAGGSSVLLVADDVDDGGNFVSDSEVLAGALPPSLSVAKAYLGEQSPAEARSALLRALGDGTLWVNYVGHGGEDLMADEALLASTDVASLDAGPKLSIVTAFTCKVGHYGLPGYDGLGETLVKQEGAGAIGVWAPSAMEDSADSARLGAIFTQSLFGGSNNVVLGDVIRATTARAAGEGLPAVLLLTYNLLGDPALRVSW